MGNLGELEGKKKTTSLLIGNEIDTIFYQFPEQLAIILEVH